MNSWPDAARLTATRIAEVVAAEADRVAKLCVRDGRVSTPLLDDHQEDAYRLAFLAAEASAASGLADYAALGDLESLLAQVALADVVRSARSRVDGTPLGDGLRGGVIDEVLVAGSAPETLEAVAAAVSRLGSGPRHLPSEIELVADTFGRFADAEVAHRAEAVHRHNRDVPEEIIEGMAGLGAFGMSVPLEYGGYRPANGSGALAMVVATEELSRGSLMAGSLLTRPEILVTALLDGGTEAQRQRWLPPVASGEAMVAVAVTEPDRGSDVAGITTMASRGDGTYVVTGAKMWATFAGRAELLMLLARTNPDRRAGARGLSLFVFEKPAFAGHAFELTQPGGGRLTGRAIDTIGYRGLHSFELAFDDWRVPADSLIGEEAGLGRGFALLMRSFATGRLQTAARAVGIMEAALREAVGYARDRDVFGRKLIDHQLTRIRLARIAARVQALRQLTYQAARHLGGPAGGAGAAMAKALTARAAEEVTRDAMQLHGGYGYAEEYAVSRLFVDARVLSIFEGTEEVLAIRVIARDLIARAAG